MTIGGGLLELVGITLLALDLVAEPARRGGANVLAAGRRLASSLRAIFGRGRAHVVQIQAAGEVSLAGELTTRVVPGTPDSIDAQIAQLRTDLEELRTRVGDLEGRLGREVAELRQALQRVRDDLEALIRRSISESRREYHEWRLGGFAIALAGSVLLACANLV